MVDQIKVFVCPDCGVKPVVETEISKCGYCVDHWRYSGDSVETYIENDGTHWVEADFGSGDIDYYACKHSEQSDEFHECWRCENRKDVDKCEHPYMMICEGCSGRVGTTHKISAWNGEVENECWNPLDIEEMYSQGYRSYKIYHGKIEYIKPCETCNGTGEVDWCTNITRKAV